jgi:uncharacterized membrane protein YbjE (DUF340 family)
MDMYWLNCFLLMVLAFLAGAYYKNAQWQGRLAMMAKAGLIGGVQIRVPTEAESTVTKH